MCACVHRACLHGNENVCAWPDVMDSTVTLVVLEPLPHSLDAPFVAVSVSRSKIACVCTTYKRVNVDVSKFTRWISGAAYFDARHEYKRVVFMRRRRLVTPLEVHPDSAGLD